MDETESRELDEHLKKYLSSSSNDCGFCHEPEFRYSMEGYQRAKVLPAKDYNRGRNIWSSVGSSRAITDVYERELKTHNVDSSCIIRSSM